MLQFNTRGLLVPNISIPSTLSILENEFSKIPDTHVRKNLFDKYIIYSDSLKELTGEQHLVQWIDGSYVTKKRNPNDIDLVTFVHAKALDQLSTKVDNFKYPLSLSIYGVDAYIIKTYNSEDIKYPLYIGDRMYWMDHFDKTNRNKNGQRFPKGFLEIIY